MALQLLGGLQARWWVLHDSEGRPTPDPKGIARIERIEAARDRAEAREQRRLKASRAASDAYLAALRSADR